MTYRLSPAAEADIDEIWTYTAQRWSRGQANRYIENIRERIEALADGRIPSRPADDVRAGYSKCPAGSHMIYFQRGATEVVVVRILHQNTDVAARLRN